MNYSVSIIAKIGQSKLGDAMLMATIKIHKQGSYNNLKNCTIATNPKHKEGKKKKKKQKTKT